MVEDMPDSDRSIGATYRVAAMYTLEPNQLLKNPQLGPISTFIMSLQLEMSIIITWAFSFGTSEYQLPIPCFFSDAVATKSPPMALASSRA